MLSRKTLGVAGAAILGSVAMLATNTASAAIDIDKGTGVKVAKETLLATATTTPTGTTTKYYNLVQSTTGGEYDLMVKQGVAFGSGTVHLRIELMNMVFNSATGADAITSSGAGAVAQVSGRGDGDNTVVLSIAGNAASSAASVVTIPVDSISVLPNAAGSVKVTWHRDALDAAFGTDAFRTVMANDVVKVVDGLEEKGTSSDSMSDVASGFSMFDGDNSTQAPIGYLRIKTADNAMHQAGTAVRGPGSFVAVAEDAVMVTFKGDFSNHTFTVHPSMDCSGTALSGDDAPALNAAKNELEVELENATGTAADDLEDAEVDPQTIKVVMLALCMMVDEKNTMLIPDTDYMATVKYMKITDAMFPRADQTVTIGNIGRTGATVHLPVLTTDPRYNQKIVIVNRGGEATYSLMVEDGTVDSMYVNATLAANSTTNIRVEDAVMTPEGMLKRTSGHINFVTNPGSVSVATIQTNRETNDTDTVIYMVD